MPLPRQEVDGTTPKYLRDKYAIVGVGETTYTRGSGISTRALGTWAVRNAILDAGLNPSDIKYVIVSHGHADHSGGAKFLQDTFHPRVLLSAQDWDLLDRSNGTRPARDMIMSDGQKLTLGDTTLTMYITPGHTAGTVSTLIPVKDRGTPHLVAEWGGTLIGGLRTLEGIQTYINSAERFRDIVAKAGADVIISNHTNYDGSKIKLPAVLNRKQGDPNPYVIGKDAVQRYLTVADECAKASLADLTSSQTSAPPR